MLCASRQKQKEEQLSNADGKLTVKDADEVVFISQRTLTIRLLDRNFKDSENI